MTNWDLIGTKLVGVLLILLGVYFLFHYKTIKQGQQAFTGRWVIETTHDYGKIIIGICMLFLGLLLVINP